MVDISDIKASVQSRALIIDDFFRDARFLTDSRGRLISYVGGYSVVIPCFVNDHKWAFRCWHVPVADAQIRYSLISEYIHQLKLPYFCSFDYTEKGLVVNGDVLPSTKMVWVEGQDLKKYICNNCDNSRKMKNLANAFLKMVFSLHQKGIAHGDLQHGNIIVSDTGQLSLVDYDSMYVPTMKDDYSDVICGLIDYQHPQRKTNKVSSCKLDYFSEIIIYTSILGIYRNPSFVSDYSVANTERLLFSSTDFDSFESSKIYNDLKSLDDSEINRCLSILTDYLKETNISDLEPIESYLFTIDFSAPQCAAYGEECIIRWKSDGIKNLAIKDVGNVSLSGKYVIKPKSTVSYTFLITTKKGYKTERTLEIPVYHRGAILKFEPDRYYTYRSVPLQLFWDCQEMVSVEIDGYGPQNSKGSIEIEVNEDKTFTLNAKDHFGEFTKTVKVWIIPFPVVKEFRVPKIETTYKTNLNITYPHIDIKAIIPSTKVLNSGCQKDLSINVKSNRLMIIPSSIEISKGIMVMSNKASALMENLVKIVRFSGAKLVNNIIRHKQ